MLTAEEGGFWFFIFTLVQIWITKIVWTYYRALSSIPPERLEVLFLSCHPPPHCKRREASTF